jgi:hypothetical protein
MFHEFRLSIKDLAYVLGLRGSMGILREEDYLPH